MPTVVTALLYSGRSNPRWELSENQEGILSDLLKIDLQVTSNSSAGSFGKLGYSGFLVESKSNLTLPDNTYVFDGILNINDAFFPNFIDGKAQIELFLLSTSTNSLTDDEKLWVENEINQNTERGLNTSIQPFSLLNVPAFNPTKWNEWDIMPKNNCYNYASDKITNTFAQPGKGSGHQYTEITVDEVKNAAVFDGQIIIESSQLAELPSEGHYICLVVWPGRDYHWYRLDRTGIWSERNMWSHKPGQTWAKNWDGSGNPIWNPEEADFRPYTEFCGYFHSIPSEIKIA